MSKSETLRGVFRTLLWLTKQEFNEMDHKLIKIGAGIAMFITMGLFWFYVFRHFSPFF